MEKLGSRFDDNIFKKKKFSGSPQVSGKDKTSMLTLGFVNSSKDIESQE
jgi:hypothetical protein